MPECGSSSVTLRLFGIALPLVNDHGFQFGPLLVLCLDLHQNHFEVWDVLPWSAQAGRGDGQPYIFCLRPVLLGQNLVGYGTLRRFS